MGDDLYCSTSNLLCAENSITCFDEANSNATVGLGLSHSPSRKNRSFELNGSDSLMGFPLECGEIVRAMVERESEHFPKHDYLERLRVGDLILGVRREALDWIWKVQAYYNFSPQTVNLSVNYLDRFLSIYQFPTGQSWIVQLTSVACVSLAAKMEETEVPLSVALQIGEPKFVFEAKTIQRMELLVLSTLKWRMQAVTPFSFIDYFLSKINTGRNLSDLSISRSIQLILNTINGIDCLEFRPSEIAAAVATSISVELQGIDINKAISCFEHVHVHEGRLKKCIELITSLSSVSGSGNGSAAGSSVPQSPAGVLDAAFWCYRSDESMAHSSHNDTNIKRRRLSSSEVGSNSRDMGFSLCF